MARKLRVEVVPTRVCLTFLPGLAIDEIGFATLPVHVYRNLVQLARGSNQQTRTQLQEGPAAKVAPGRRRDLIFRYCCALRRWTADRDENTPTTPERAARGIADTRGGVTLLSRGCRSGARMA
ncbi:MAG TPA: hypothetical protein VJ375_16990 [Gaiellaceae bacterium]|jgi:hypothetical protein|nr:hypothetical protein [Gaiellaceae bacterium]